MWSRDVERQVVRHLVRAFVVRALCFGRRTEVRRHPLTCFRHDADVGEGTIPGSEAGLVQIDVYPVAGVNPLHRRLVAVPGRVELRAAERLGEIRRKSLVVLRVQVMLERMRSDRVLQAQLVPPPGQSQDGVESAHQLVQRRRVRSCLSRGPTPARTFGIAGGPSAIEVPR